MRKSFHSFHSFHRLAKAFYHEIVCIQAYWPSQLEIILVSITCVTKSITTSPLDGMLVHHKVPPPPSILSGFPENTPGWRDAQWEESILPKNTTQWAGQVLNPDPSTRVQHTEHQATVIISHRFSCLFKASLFVKYFQRCWQG